MGGHSHWSTIKRQKASQDAKRGQLFTKLAREIVVAARASGPDPDMNPRLRLAIDKARSYNMPMDNIERAIKRGSGQVEGADLIEATFEGYGPGGVAILVDVLADNRNRAVQELRTTLARGGGNLGEAGCVAWQFQSKGVIEVNVGVVDPDEVGLIAIDAGADDVRVEKEKGQVVVYTESGTLDRVQQALANSGLTVESAELAMIPTSTVALGEATAVQMLRLLDSLEELDDVQSVYSNADFPDAVLMEYAGR